MAWLLLDAFSQSILRTESKGWNRKMEAVCPGKGKEHIEHKESADTVGLATEGIRTREEKLHTSYTALQQKRSIGGYSSREGPRM